MENNLTKNILVDDKIFIIRGVQVMLDSDLAELYGVETKRINEAVKNNIDKFPQDFLFELTKEEFANLRSKVSTSSYGGRRYVPKVFTEQGVYMLATILKSKVATEVTINIIRTFAKLREFALNYKDIVIELKNIKEELKATKENGLQNTQHIKTAFELLSQILDDTSKTNKNLIGFRVDKEN